MGKTRQSRHTQKSTQLTRVAFISLGCPKNLVDTETMMGQLGPEYQLTNQADIADILVINTCCFISEATRETCDTISEFKFWKKQGRKLVVTGCYAQEQQNRIFEMFPHIDAILGPQHINDFRQLLKRITDTDAVNYTGDQLSTQLHSYSMPRVLATPSHYAYIKLGDGCSHRCSFCKIPLLRGASRFKKPQDIMEEARALSMSGVKELILISQDLTNYRHHDVTLSQLLESINNTDVDWIRLMYLYPDAIGDELIKVINQSEKIVKYIDMPIQHINDRILSRMNRKSTKQSIIDLIKKLRDQISGIKLRTSVIVGFPGETDQEFEELQIFLSQNHFDHLGVFTYSLEKNTPSYTMRGQVKEEVKQARYDALMQQQQRISKDLNQQYVEQVLPVMIDNLEGGRRYFDAPDIDGYVYVDNMTSPDKIGTIQRVKIKRALEYDLVGVIG